MITVGRRFDEHGTRWYNEIKEVLKTFKNRALVVYRTDWEDCNWTAIVKEDSNGIIHGLFLNNFDKSLLDDFDNRQNEYWLHLED